MEALKGKTYKTYDSLSRYSSFPIYYNEYDNKWVTGTTAYLRDDTPYSAHTVSKNDSYDSIALAYYGNPTLYWIICSFNHIQDAFEDPKPGTVLKIPTISKIDFNI